MTTSLQSILSCCSEVDSRNLFIHTLLFLVVSATEKTGSSYDRHAYKYISGRAKLRLPFTPISLFAVKVQTLTWLSDEIVWLVGRVFPCVWCVVLFGTALPVLHFLRNTDCANANAAATSSELRAMHFRRDNQQDADCCCHWLHRCWLEIVRPITKCSVFAIYFAFPVFVPTTKLSFHLVWFSSLFILSVPNWLLASWLVVFFFLSHSSSSFHSFSFGAPPLVFFQMKKKSFLLSSHSRLVNAILQLRWFACDPERGAWMIGTVYAWQRVEEGIKRYRVISTGKMRIKNWFWVT